MAQMFTCFFNCKISLVEPTTSSVCSGVIWLSFSEIEEGMAIILCNLTEF